MLFTKKKIRRLNIEVHRDLGYFFTVLIIAYCLSGIALNHVDDWNPDFVIRKETIHIPKDYQMDKITKSEILELSKMAGENSYKVYDFPTRTQVKIYYDNSSLHVNFATHSAVYENVSRRPVFYHANLLHRNSIKGWKWAADAFAMMLILISATGLFVLKGKYGIKGRGKWLVGAGLVVPLGIILFHELV